MNLTASVTVAKNGKKHYTLFDGDAVVHTRKSDRDYTHIVYVEYSNIADNPQPIIEFAGRLDLAQKRVAHYAKWRYVTGTHIVPVEAVTA